MPQILDSEFIEISVPVLNRISGVIHFDIYIRRAANTYTKIFKSGEPIDPAFMDRYWHGKGIESLYVNRSQYRQYLMYVEHVANKYLNQDKSDMTPDEMTLVVKDMADLAMLEIYVDMKVDRQAITHSSTVIKGCVNILASNPKSLTSVFRWINSHPYLMKHSIQTAVFSLLLAQKEKLESDKTFSNLGIGALLHDIGMSQLSFNAEEKEFLKPQEWKEIKEHPHLGKRLLDGIEGLSSTSEISTIVLQHHEQPNGAGYPNSSHQKDIYYLSKMVSIADSFSALINKRPYREAMAPMKALEVMNADHGKFDSRLLGLFTELFISVK